MYLRESLNRMRVEGLNGLFRDLFLGGGGGGGGLNYLFSVFVRLKVIANENVNLIDHMAGNWS